MMSLHINNQFAKKRGIGKNLSTVVRTVMFQEQVDLVAGDFYGAAWRRQSGSEHRPISTIEEAFANPGDVPGEWADVCGFIQPPGCENEWQTRMHGAFIIPYDTLGIKRADQSCHHRVWIHLLHVSATGRPRIPG